MSSKTLLANALAGLDTGKHHDGDGLWFRVRPNGSRAWFIRYHSPTSDKRRDMGLGAYPAISLKQARAKNDELRDHVFLQRQSGHSGSSNCLSLSSPARKAVHKPIEDFSRAK